MANKSRTDLITRALEVLGVIAAGQAPAAEDVQVIETNLDALLAELAADEIATIDPDDIDPSMFNSAAIFVADRMRADFGAPMDAAMVADAKATLRRIGRRRATYIPQVTSYI
jgi:hypothetical protein